MNANQDALSQAELAIRAADPAAALLALTAAVKARPGDARLRIFLAQLLCVLGQWERAHAQLNVAADLDATAGPMREMTGHALRCELLRTGVFAGQRAPLVFGQPDQWLALLIESLLQSGDGPSSAADALAAQAFDAAPATPGRIDGVPFDWIADADSRLGPVLEAMVNGRYYWIPFARLAAVAFEPPTDLRDQVWLPAQLTFANGGEAVALVPVRYPGSHASTDGHILCARATEWRPIGAAANGTDDAPQRYAGLGQRVLATDAAEYDLLAVRRIEFDPQPAEADADNGPRGA